MRQNTRTVLALQMYFFFLIDYSATGGWADQHGVCTSLQVPYRVCTRVLPVCSAREPALPRPGRTSVAQPERHRVSARTQHYWGQCRSWQGTVGFWHHFDFFSSLRLFLFLCAFSFNCFFPLVANRSHAIRWYDAQFACFFPLITKR